MADAYDIIDESRLLPNVQDSFGRQVRIIHPGYYYSGGDPDFDVLISFEAFDDGGSGVDYDTAHTACAIIAGNTWDGYFSKDPRGKEKIHPPNRLLSYERYSRTSLFSTDQIDAPANLLPLRCDIHKLFDERHFTFVPKQGISRGAREKYMEEAWEAHAEQLLSHAEGSGPSPDSQLPIRRSGPSSDSPQNNSRIQIVGHVFNSTPSGDLPRRFHNRATHTLPSTLSIDLLFARFAYTIFSPSIFKDFLDSDKGRYVKTWDHEKKRHDVGFASAEKCRAIWNASRSRSESPRKRSKATGDGPEDSYGAGLGSDVDSGYGDNSQTSFADDGSGRGRTRKRGREENDLDIFEAKRAKLRGRTKQKRP
ncbi:hypothetical protein FBULB1_1410 [Fusarium bulbicola]|nr:hypothetical protein FBULB1_1410 [Fusarium bulbicola]